MKRAPAYLIVSAALLITTCNGSQQPSVAPSGMVYVPGNETAGAVFMDIAPVTIGQFREFVEATGYITQAEKFGDAGVFTIDQNWHLVKGATWEFPMGPDNQKAPHDHPVTQVSYNDALAYAQWAGKRLPTEAEWINASMDADQIETQYNWGEQLVVEGRFMANTWQGSFPYYNSNEDGFLTTSPVGTFGKTKLGLEDISGNVWEWTSDWKVPQDLSKVEFKPDSDSEKIIRGGSFLCDPSFCHGYRLDGVSSSTPETSLFHTGFRCVKDVSPNN